MRRLEEAGWTDPDGDGVRARAGVPLRLTLQTNADNPLRVRLSEFVAAQLRPVGFDIVVHPMGFEELTDTLLGQRYDMVVIGWENLGADPGNSPFWHSRDDVPGAGFNFTSFQDADVDNLLDAALQNPTCDVNAARRRLPSRCRRVSRRPRPMCCWRGIWQPGPMQPVGKALRPDRGVSTIILPSGGCPKVVLQTRHIRQDASDKTPQTGHIRQVLRGMTVWTRQFEEDGDTTYAPCISDRDRSG